ncbi:MAG: alpha/beta fold hydrolase [Actinomycetota bacterium]
MAVRRIDANGVGLHVVDEGEGAPVLLLHGFPDSSALWRHQIPVLTGAGMRVVAPDLRGFGESDRPEGVGAYAMEHLVGDALAVLDALELPSVQVVGHDWGAVVAWVLAALAPDRVTRVAGLSVGHPSGYFATLQQRRMSWYMLLFRHEQAEYLLRREDWRWLRASLAGNDVDRCIADLSRPGALTASLSVYRANIRPEAFVTAQGPVLPPITAPAMGIWSERDFACSEEAMVATEQFVTGPWRYERIDDVGHWIPVGAPGRLNDLLLDFLEP